MLTATIIVFAIAAIGGMILATKVLTGKLAPWPLGIIHALLGATGLGMLAFLAITNNDESILLAALSLFAFAALGGFYLFSFHLKQALAPKPAVLIHAGFAVVGFVTLLSLFI